MCVKERERDHIVFIAINLLYLSLLLAACERWAQSRSSLSSLLRALKSDVKPKTGRAHMSKGNNGFVIIMQ